MLQKIECNYFTNRNLNKNPNINETPETVETLQNPPHCFNHIVFNIWLHIEILETKDFFQWRKVSPLTSSNDIFFFTIPKWRFLHACGCKQLTLHSQLTRQINHILLPMKIFTINFFHWRFWLQPKWRDFHHMHSYTYVWICIELILHSQLLLQTD